VLLSGWRFSEPFYDPFCGSGTIAIEAAMIAKNIAPGLSRRFAFETLPFRDTATLDRLKEELRGEGIPIEAAFDLRVRHGRPSDRKSPIECRDGRALGRYRLRSEGISLLRSRKAVHATLVTNPPYGERLESGDDEGIRRVHQTLFDVFKNNPDLTGGVITSNAEFALRGKALGMKDRKIPNGPIPCRFCFRTAAR
jgi:putative N6-adenine-specific DNA methylase